VHKDQVQPIPTPRATVPVNLADYVPPEIIRAIEKAGKISFHAVGDTSAAKANRTQAAPPRKKQPAKKARKKAPR
jgi:hypothetical protein